MKVTDDGTTNPIDQKAMSAWIDFVAQGDTDLVPALARATAEIERLREVSKWHGAETDRLRTEQQNLRASLESACDDLKERDAEIERLKASLQLAQRWAAEAADALQPSAEENTRLRHNEAFHVERAAAQDVEIERLRALLHRWHVWSGYEGHDLSEETRAALEGK